MLIIEWSSVADEFYNGFDHSEEPDCTEIWYITIDNKPIENLEVKCIIYNVIASNKYIRFL